MKDLEVSRLLEQRHTALTHIGTDAGAPYQCLSGTEFGLECLATVRVASLCSGRESESFCADPIALLDSTRWKWHFGLTPLHPIEKMSQGSWKLNINSGEARDRRRSQPSPETGARGQVCVPRS